MECIGIMTQFGDYLVIYKVFKQFIKNIFFFIVCITINKMAKCGSSMGGARRSRGRGRTARRGRGRAYN